jgi:hypothetical protein
VKNKTKIVVSKSVVFKLSQFAKHVDAVVLSAESHEEFIFMKSFGLGKGLILLARMCQVLLLQSFLT